MINFTGIMVTPGGSYYNTDKIVGWKSYTDEGTSISTKGTKIIFDSGYTACMKGVNPIEVYDAYKDAKRVGIVQLHKKACKN